MGIGTAAGACSAGAGAGAGAGVEFVKRLFVESGGGLGQLAAGRQLWELVASSAVKYSY